MADIKVERKGRNLWPWIVGLVVLVLLVLALTQLLVRNQPEEVDQDPVVTGLLA